MSLRVRLTLAAAAAVAVAVVIVAAISYFTVQQKLLDEVDRALTNESEPLASPRVLSRMLVEPHDRDDPFLRETRSVQVVLADGRTGRPPGNETRLPVDAADRAVARGERAVHFHDVHVNGAHLRVITRVVGTDAAVQLARPLGEIDHTLDSLRLILVLVAGAGVAIATGIGWVVARAALKPVAKLTEAAEHVAETQDLGAPIDVTTHDEIGRLATSFNEMLAALDASRQQQRQLVADASHELRTPLTSLRTNIEVLARQRDMPLADRELLLADVVTQLEELSVLVGDLVELAREDGMPQGEEPIGLRLDELVDRAVVRARLHAPAVSIVVTTCEPTVVDAQRALLERAVSNILDNACKWSPPGGEIDVTLEDGTLSVRDHGPGIDPADVPHIFDLLYRTPAARGMPGSGLGLSIVRHAAHAHGGAVTADPAPGGGTIIRLRLPDAEQVAPVPVVELDH